MRLIVTGGGTGGHVFPALEVARRARDAGCEVRYFGSFRGQERRACEKEGVPFAGFPSQPLYSLKTPAGWKAAVNLLRATWGARRSLGRVNPDVIFSTGGYSSAPVVNAARSLGIPYVIHEQNSIPGRSNLLVSRGASAVCTVFEVTQRHFLGVPVVRTGMPVRQELRTAAGNRKLDLDVSPLRILVVGGSQGAMALNEASLGTAARMTERDLHWLHVTGKSHFESVFASFEKLGIGRIYEVKAFLEGSDMASAYAEANLVVGRSGAGTLAELAAFRLPCVLVPYPSAYANHQFHNAEEFESIGAGVIIKQDDLHPSTLMRALEDWIDSPERREKAQNALMEWDRPHAPEQILELIEAAAKKK